MPDHPSPAHEHPGHGHLAVTSPVASRAEALLRLAGRLYLVCLVGLPLLALRTPIGRLWRHLTDGIALTVLSPLGVTGGTRDLVLRVLFVVVLAAALQFVARLLLEMVVPHLAATHTLNHALEEVPPDRRSTLLERLRAGAAARWTTLAEAGTGVTVVPAAWWRGFAVVAVMVGLIPPVGTPREPRLSSVLAADTPDEDGTTGPAARFAGGTDPGSGLPGYAAILEGDHRRGIEQLQAAARRGEERAYAVLGLLHATGSGVPRDLDEARRLWGEGIERGDPASAFYLARHIALTEPTDPETWEQVYRLARQGAEPGSPARSKAQVLLGFLYLTGKGTALDTAAGRRVLEGALTGRSLYAARNLVSLETTAGNLERANTLLRAGAASGMGVLQLWLAERYRADDLGLSRDDRLAHRWALRAARQGIPEAQVIVGEQLHRGEGVTQDPAEAARWFRLAAEQGNAYGMEWLGFTLRTARPIEAYVWYNLAASRGKTSAVKRRDDMAANLTREQVDNAQAFTSNWKVKEGIEGLPLQGSGTGFFVSPYHELVTNEHVIGGCLRLAVDVGGTIWGDVEVVGADQGRDLALIRINPGDGETLSHPVARFAPGPSELGEQLVVFGYPLSTMLSASGALNFGSLSANAGIGNDTSLIQISVPIQPGNSGGAVLDQSGRVVGVVVASLRPVQQGSNVVIPQNVNFAIKGSVLQELLHRFDMRFMLAAAGADHRDGVALGRLARSVSARILCYGPPRI